MSDLHQRVMELEEALEKNIKDHDQVLKDQVAESGRRPSGAAS